MTTINNGGPAFPHDDLALYNERSGMTLRDYFAAKAMSGMCFGSPIPKADELGRIAIRSYEMADAMLRARELK